MATFSIAKLKDEQICKLVENRWTSSDSIWQIVEKTYKINTSAYQNESEWLDKVPASIQKVLANRITPNMEAVINSVYLIFAS